MKKLLVFAAALLLCVAIMCPALAEYGYTRVSDIPMAVDFTFRVDFDAKGEPHIVTDYPYKATGANQMNLVYSKDQKVEALVLRHDFKSGSTYIGGGNSSYFDFREEAEAYKAIRDGVLVPEYICINTTKHNISETDWVLTYSLSQKAYTKYSEKTNSQAFNGMGAGGTAKTIYYVNGTIDYSSTDIRIDTGDLVIRHDKNGNIVSAYISLYKGANTGFYLFRENTGLFDSKKPSELGFSDDDINIPPLAALGSKRDPSANQKIEAYVTRCYQIILGRDPDEGGLKTWYNELNTGRKAAAEIIDQFVSSAEFTNKKVSNADAVEILYKAMLDRSSDPAGKADWVAKLNAGQPLQAVINGFCGSGEFGNLCKSYGIKPGTVNVPDVQPEQPQPSDEKIQAYVARCYKIILGRDADEGGMKTWVNELNSGRKAAAEIIDAFVKSAEFQNKKHSNPDAVEILYKAMLGRSPDAAGKASWVSQLENGQPLTAVINGFCASAEFKGICNSYGITPGTVKVQALSTQADETLSGRNAAQETPVMKKTENNNVTKVEIVNAGGAENENLGTAVQAVYVNEEKAKEFISRCYRSILGREASQAELDSWIGQMLNGSKTPDQIARGFLFSGEFESRNIGGEELVKILYRVYLNREADAEGLATWTQKLNEGTSLQELLNTFSRTSEFKAVVKGMAN